MRKICIFVCAGLFLLAGVAFGQNGDLVGAWETKDGVTIEFNDDGTVSQDRGGQLIAGEYTLIGDNRLYIASEEDDAIWKYRLVGDTLTLYKGEEDTVQYKKKE